MQRGSRSNSVAGPAGEGKKPKNTLGEIQRLEKERNERRRAMEEAKRDRANEEQRNKENGTPGDVDFQRMIKGFREKAPTERTHNVSDMKITICVRKRPISNKEIARHDYDSVTCLNPKAIVHYCKLKVDGISKYLDNNAFGLDHTFHEDNTTEEIYAYCVEPLIDFVLDGGRGTVFAYGQTGSGKTYTMQGIQTFLAEDLFAMLSQRSDKDSIQVFVSFFEIYGGRCQDLLNSRQRLNVREDGGGEVIIGDLLEIEVDSVDSLHGVIENGNRNRTTHATESNDESSRSHAICQVSLRNVDRGGKEVGRLSLIDLAGSERGADTKSHNRQRRMEGAEINKSLLALKECIRALDGNSGHVPYRGSKLTLVLKDSFTNQKSKTVMIAAVSPAASSADHTINTLRYADRIKERKGVGGGGGKALSPPTVSNAAPKGDGPRRVSDMKARDDKDGDRVRPSERLKRVNEAAAARDYGGGAKGERDVRGGREGGRGNVPAASKENRNNKGYAEENYDLADEEDIYDQLLAGGENRRGGDDELEEDAATDELHKTVQDLFEEEEALLNMHMNVIQENAELLTEEGRLLQHMQGEDSDIDAYASRLEQILQRKQELIEVLQERLKKFRKQLIMEETVSRKVRGLMPDS